jgi:tRNA 2-selenouridine synthase
MRTNSVMQANSSTRKDSANFRDIFLRGLPMMDTRAPVEFKQGAFPNTVNLPLMSDIERQKVGTCYKQHGQEAAITLGHQLVSGSTKAERIHAWADFARKNPDGYLYCFRGGLRSQITQQWLKTEAGIEYPRITGGYKAMRTFLLETTQQAIEQCSFIVVGGLTGTGKTEVIAQIANSLDLEGHANHRGSSFGKRATRQPAQITFENALAIDILRKRASGMQRFLLEDESHLIGSCALPVALHTQMQNFPLVWLDDSLASRIERILHDYVINLSAEFIAVHGEENGFQLFAEQLLQNLGNITKRLGHERYQKLAAIMQQALAEQRANSSAVDLHRAWIAGLLNEYYDPMYAFQREKKSDRIVFSGEQQAVVEYLQTHWQHTS